MSPETPPPLGLHDANGRTNILLFGSGGKEWDEGTDLTDTIMVASIDPEKHRATLISIPRDLFVQIPGLPAMTRGEGTDL